jgi:hypothetical protein
MKLIELVKQPGSYFPRDKEDKFLILSPDSSELRYACFELKVWVYRLKFEIQFFNVEKPLDNGVKSVHVGIWNCDRLESQVKKKIVTTF